MDSEIVIVFHLIRGRYPQIILYWGVQVRIKQSSKKSVTQKSNRILASLSRQSGNEIGLVLEGSGNHFGILYLLTARIKWFLGYLLGLSISNVPCSSGGKEEKEPQFPPSYLSFPLKASPLPSHPARKGKKLELSTLEPPPTYAVWAQPSGGGAKLWTPPSCFICTRPGPNVPIWGHAGVCARGGAQVWNVTFHATPPRPSASGPTHQLCQPQASPWLFCVGNDFFFLTLKKKKVYIFVFGF